MLEVGIVLDVRYLVVGKSKDSSLLPKGKEEGFCPKVSGSYIGKKSFTRMK